MVLKKSKAGCGNTGNTLRSEYRYRGLRVNRRHAEFIRKDDKRLKVRLQEQQGVNTPIDWICEDGLHCKSANNKNVFNQKNVSYSLNRDKRWQLVNVLKKGIEAKSTEIVQIMKEEKDSNKFKASKKQQSYGKYNYGKNEFHNHRSYTEDLSKVVIKETMSKTFPEDSVKFCNYIASSHSFQDNKISANWNAEFVSQDDDADVVYTVTRKYPSKSWPYKSSCLNYDWNYHNHYNYLISSPGKNKRRKLIWNEEDLIDYTEDSEDDQLSTDAEESYQNSFSDSKNYMQKEYSLDMFVRKSKRRHQKLLRKSKPTFVTEQVNRASSEMIIKHDKGSYKYIDMPILEQVIRNDKPDTTNHDTISSSISETKSSVKHYMFENSRFVYWKRFIKNVEVVSSNTLLNDMLSNQDQSESNVIVSGVDLCQICFTTSCLVSVEHCNHCICSACLSAYIDEKINLGIVFMHCPDFKCETQLAASTIVKFASESKKRMYTKRVLDMHVQKASNLKHCPNGECSFVAKLPNNNECQSSCLSKLSVVNCECLNDWCFHCQENVHWPATCEAYKSFEEQKRKDIGIIYNKHGEIYTLEVSVRKCPLCKNPIDKNGGCPYMACICGGAFCWTCLQNMNKHDAKKCKQVKDEKLTFTSLDDRKNGTRKVRMLRTAVQYEYEINRVKSKMTKLKVSKPQYHAQMGVARNAFHLVLDCYKLLGNLMLVRSSCNSRHLNRRLFIFCDKLEFLLKLLNDSLNVKVLSDIKCGIVLKYQNELMDYLEHLKTIV